MVLCSFTSDMAPASSKEFLDIQAKLESEFTLKLVHDMIITYSQNRCSQKFCKIRKKTPVPESSQKYRSLPSIRCFMINFERYLKQNFRRIPPSDYFCSPEKYLTIKIVKRPLKKETKMETAGKKNDTRRKKT